MEGSITSGQQHSIATAQSIKKYLYNAVFDERTVILSDQFISKIVSAEAGTMTFSKKDHQDVS
ncbi:hypothetical protein PVAP13_5KG369900 [Panicum virgatum]|uniref:Uncharacterized protein n=1 Tax=Panicum virgatum TaxID=38727 RepID=A0A8T0SN26_PANVG|nr:hypothetical protein PVAP13_5KG369900 [Panicum virgatum]